MPRTMASMPPSEDRSLMTLSTRTRPRGALERRQPRGPVPFAEPAHDVAAEALLEVVDAPERVLGLRIVGHALEIVDLHPLAKTVLDRRPVERVARHPLAELVVEAAPHVPRLPREAQVEDRARGTAVADREIERRHPARHELREDGLEELGRVDLD